MRSDEVAEEADRSAGEQSPAESDGVGSRPDDAREIPDLPTLPEVVDGLADDVESGEIVGLIVFDATPLETWEYRHGADAFDDLLRRFAASTAELRGASIRDDDTVCRNAPGGGSILVFLNRPRDGRGPSEPIEFDDVAERTRERTVDSIANGDPDLRDALERIQVGTSLILGKQSIDPRRQIYRAVRRARDDIRDRERERIERLHQAVGSVIAQRDIETLYQPIVELSGQSPIGYEALSRVGTDSGHDLDDPLFAAAAKVELEAELDQICRSLSINRRPGLEEGERLFVNCLPDAFHQPTHELESLLDQWLDEEGLEPHQLIFEINEKISQAEADRILPTIRRLRRGGFQFALDDVGTGKTNLRLLADLEPTYIKMDISLTRGIGDSVRKQALASYLLDLADKSEARLIAEGVESQRDLDTIVELGVDYAQGHLIGRPGEYGEFI